MRWDFYSAVTVNRQIVSTPTLPEGTSTYGNLHVVDNMVPIVQRTYTCDHIDHDKVSDIIEVAKARYACCTVTAPVTGTYTGRLINMSLQQVPGVDSFQCTLVLQDMDTEITGTPRTVYDLDNL